VTIGQNGPDCIVEETSDTQIVCRIEETDQVVDDAHEVLVFLKLSEEAICSMDSGCMFTWLTAKHELTGVDISVNASGDQIITLTSDGSNLFVDDPVEEVELWLDSYVQQTDSVSDGVAVFTVLNLNDISTSDI
jgi:hypothetical protein